MRSRSIRAHRERLLARVAALRGAVESLEPRRLLSGTIELLPLGSEPAHLTDVNGTLFFSADDGVHGRELWKTDGTAEGTVLVKDIAPGTASGVRQWDFETECTNVNGKLFFLADDGEHGLEVWVSDGTGSGTHLVKDICPPSAPDWSEPPTPRELTAVGNQLFFAAHDGVHGEELWVSDGSAVGTMMVKDIAPGEEGSWPEYLVAYDDKLFFAHGGGLWRSDGTAGGTVLVKEVGGPRHLRVHEGLLWFTISDGYVEIQWQSDGTTAGTVPATRNFPNGLAVNGVTYWPEWQADPESIQLWRSDGTLQGTFPVTAFAPSFGIMDLFGLTDVDGTVFFGVWQAVGYESNNGDDDYAEDSGPAYHATELWRTDGTLAGTTRLAELADNDSQFVRDSFTQLNGSLCFLFDAQTDDFTYGRVSQLWTSDGTEAGTVMLKELGLLPDNASPLPGHVLGCAGRMFFAGLEADEAGAELWMSDGTSDGTVLLKNINPKGPLQITGDGSANVIKLRRDAATLTVELDGQTRTFPLALVPHVLIDGLDGNDLIDLTGLNLPATVNGGGGGDTILGGNMADLLIGNGGNDLIVGNGGADRLYGRLGNDRLRGGSGGDRLLGDEGNDVLAGGSGNDLLDGAEGRDRLYGGDGRDTLLGGGDNDQLFGEVGKDRLHGGKGNDRLLGGGGNDWLDGHVGFDTLFGDAGNDTLFARDSTKDQLFGGADFDSAYRDAGIDELDGIERASD